MKSWKVFLCRFFSLGKRTRKLIKFFFSYCCSFFLLLLHVVLHILFENIPFSSFHHVKGKYIRKKIKGKLPLSRLDCTSFCVLWKENLIKKYVKFHLLLTFFFPSNITTRILSNEVFRRIKAMVKLKHFPVQKISSEAQRWWRSNEEIILFWDNIFDVFLRFCEKRGGKTSSPHIPLEECALKLKKLNIFRSCYSLMSKAK